MITFPPRRSESSLGGLRGGAFETANGTATAQPSLTARFRRLQPAAGKAQAQNAQAMGEATARA